MRSASGAEDVAALRRATFAGRPSCWRSCWWSWRPCGCAAGGTGPRLFADDAAIGAEAAAAAGDGGGAAASDGASWRHELRCSLIRALATFLEHTGQATKALDEDGRAAIAGLPVLI